MDLSLRYRNNIFEQILGINNNEEKYRRQNSKTADREERKLDIRRTT